MNMIVTRWPTPNSDGVLPDSGYAERFWLPVIGPTALVAARRLAGFLAAAPGDVTVDTVDLAADLGVTPATLDRTLDRLAQFGLARRPDGWTFALRHPWPRLNERRLARLGDRARADHDRLAS